MAMIFTIDDDDNVLELIEQHPEGLMVRDNGDWSPVDTTIEQPTIFDLEWVDVSDDALDFWDNAQKTDQPVTRDDISQYLIPSE